MFQQRFRFFQKTNKQNIWEEQCQTVTNKGV